MPYQIDYQKDHKNSKGESAPRVIINKDRNEASRLERQKDWWVQKEAVV